MKKPNLNLLSHSHFPFQLSPNFSVFKPTPITSHNNLELRVCTNRTCRRQGSLQTLDTLHALSPPTLTVKSSGCLGRCGSGPNVAVLPDGFIVSHCATPARAADLMVAFYDKSSFPISVSSCLEALALRKRALCELDTANFSLADLLLSQAIELKPCGGIHIIFKDRSVARLALGNYSGALDDANEALKLAPRYPEAYITQGDAFLAMDHFDLAETSYSTALEIDPSIRRSKSFKARVVKLQEKLSAANTQ